MEFTEKEKTYCLAILRKVRYSNIEYDNPKQKRGNHVEEKTVYRSREIFGENAYHFWRWQDWSDWTLTAPTEEDENAEYEERIVYRYIPQ